MENNEEKSAVEWFIDEIANHIDMPFKHFEQLKEQAKEMEKEQRKKDFVNGYKARAKESNLIFDESSEMYAIKLFNEPLN
jgi:hypothetical protein